jgi:hypothetical protein
MFKYHERVSSLFDPELGLVLAVDQAKQVSSQ